MTACIAHQFHSPRPQGFQLHHVYPVGWGGPENGKKVTLCATGHSNVHYLLDAYKKFGQTPPWEVRRSFGPGERAIAADGWDAFRKAQGG